MDNFRRRISADSKPKIVEYISLFERGTITADCINLNAVIPLVHDSTYDYTGQYARYLYYVPSQSVLFGTVTGTLSTYSRDANNNYEKVSSKNTTFNMYPDVSERSWGLLGVSAMDYISIKSKRLFFFIRSESTYNGLPLTISTISCQSPDFYDSSHTLGTDYKIKLECFEWCNDGTEGWSYVYNSTRTQCVWAVLKEDLSEVRFEMGPI